MATSGNFEKKIAGGSTGGYYVGIDWKINSQSTSNVSSNVTASVYIRSSGNGYTISSSASKNISLTINGTKYTGTNTVGISTNTKKVLLTKTVDVKHNSDGSKSCAFDASVQIGFTLSGTSLSTVSVSGTGTFNKINVNSAPTMSGVISTNPSGTIPETTNSITLSWSKASDAQGNADKYQIYRYVNGAHYDTFNINNINTLSYTDTFSGLGEGTKIDYTMWAGDSYGTWSNPIYSYSVYKNTFSGAYFTGHSNDISWNTTSFSLYVDGASNTNGNTSFKYYYYSDDVTVYNQSDSTSKTGTISIWRDSVGGAQPSGPYIKLSDLKNKFRNSNFNGRLHVGVRTQNAYGTYKWSGGSIGVDLRGEPVGATPAISEDQSLSTAYKTVSSTGNKYFLPNGKDKIRISWSGASDRIGEPVSYDVQVKIGNGSYETKASNLTSTTYDLVLPKQSSSQQIVARVITKTSYGYNKAVDSPAKTLHYYNAPTCDVIKVDRTSSGATATIKLNANTSIPNVNFPTRSYSGASSGTLSNTTNNQSITASGLTDNGTSSWTITFNDDTKFTSSNQTKKVDIPTYTPLFSVREKGVGVNAIPDGSAGLIVKKGAKVNGGLNVDTVTATTVNANNIVSGNANNASTKVTNFNNVWKSGFYDGEGASNQPFGGWNWLINCAHTNNRDGYKYGLQIAAQNNSNNFAMRTTNVEGTGNWCTLYHSGNSHTHHQGDLTQENYNHDDLNWIMGQSSWGSGRKFRSGQASGGSPQDSVYAWGAYLQFGGDSSTTQIYTPDRRSANEMYFRNTWGGQGDKNWNRVWHSGNITPIANWGSGNRITLSDWYYSTGNTGWYNSTYGGGWYMQDSTWLRSYSDKSIYTGATVKSWVQETRYLKSPDSNSNLDLEFRSGTGYLNVYSGCGAGIIVGRPWSGSSGTEPALYNNKGNGWGFLGNSGQSWYRVYGSGGSVSDRNKKYEITKADTETQYENVKELNIYNYRSLSTVDTGVREMAEKFLTHSSFEESGTKNYITDEVEIDGKIYEALDKSLSQEEIKEKRIEQIIENNPNFSECKRQDLFLGCMVDEMPLETTFYDNEGGDGKAVDMYSYTTMLLGALKESIKKIENLERRVEELENGTIN